MPSVEEALRSYAKTAFPAPGLKVVHLLLFGFDMAAPSLEDARDWASHFGLRESDGHVVLIGSPTTFGDRTRSMVPGFQLVDRDFVLRHDAAGHNPPDDLWRDLLPALPSLLAE